MENQAKKYHGYLLHKNNATPIHPYGVATAAMAASTWQNYQAYLREVFLRLVDDYF